MVGIKLLEEVSGHSTFELSGRLPADSPTQKAKDRKNKRSSDSRKCRWDDFRNGSKQAAQ